MWLKVLTTEIILYDQAGDPVDRRCTSTTENTNTDTSTTTTTESEAHEDESQAHEDESQAHEDEPSIVEQNNELTPLHEQYEEQEVSQFNGQVEQEVRECLKTRHAIEIKKVIGSSSDIKQFDELRYRQKPVSEQPISDSLTH